MQKKVTINEIAEQLGVSRATVSRALNGSAGVGDAMREKICKYAESVNYKVTPQVQDVEQERRNVIGLVFGDVRNPFYADLTFHIQKALNRHGYMVMMLNSEYDADKEIEFLKVAQEYGLAGLLLFTTQTNMDSIRYQTGNTPVVFVNRTPEHNNFDSVTTDNFEAGYMAAMHLINLGHTKIGFVTGPAVSSASSKRVEGFQQAMRNYFLPIPEEYIVEGDLKMAFGYQMAERFFQMDNRPTAMIFGNDLMAIGFMDWCQEHQIAIPDQLSVMGFDDIDFSGLQGVQLTTISQHVQEMGEQAADMIIRRIEKKDLDYRRIILKPTLIQRKSTGAIPK